MTLETIRDGYFGLCFIRGWWPLRQAISGVFGVCWNIEQKHGPVLDELEGNWVFKTSGYCVTARKS